MLKLNQIGEEMKSKRDPISRYNLVIEQYNDPVNRKQEIFLKTAHNNFFYKFWFALQGRCLFILLVLYFIPYITMLTFLGNFITEIVQEVAVITYKSNQKKNSNILESMIYNPVLCNRGSANFLYFEVNSDNLESFKFDPEILAKIEDRHKNSHDRKIRFMVYNNLFLAGFQNLTSARFITFIHLVLNTVILLIMQYYVYEKIFCIDFLSFNTKMNDC
jgi:hypothetical protein